MQDINNTGSDDQESSSADRYLAVTAKHAGTQNQKDFPSHRVQWLLSQATSSHPFRNLTFTSACSTAPKTLSGEVTGFEVAQ